MFRHLLDMKSLIFYKESLPLFYLNLIADPQLVYLLSYLVRSNTFDVLRVWIKFTLLGTLYLPITVGVFTDTTFGPFSIHFESFRLR